MLSSHKSYTSLYQKPIIKITFIFLLLSLIYFLNSFLTTSSSPHTISIHTNNNTPLYFHNATNAINVPDPVYRITPENTYYSPVSLHLDFSAELMDVDLPSPPHDHLPPVPTCADNFTHYCPCQDRKRMLRFPNDRYFRRERHCPEYEYEKVKCLVPCPKGYKRTFPWPKSRETAWYSNVPFEWLANEKKKQNWVRLKNGRFFFPGGGTSFPKGVKGYVDVINQIVKLDSGTIRTALDVGCGVATFGGALLDYNIQTMSIAPVDTHEAQVQLALERGLPAMIGILSTFRLPYPSRAFDLVHCARCLVKWADYDGLYLLEVDRILRPGGYWVLSGPPIGWKTKYKGWERTRADLEKEQKDLEDLAKRICWRKVGEKGPVAVWQKPNNHVHCRQKLKIWKSYRFCDDDDPDSAWYKKMELCITPLPGVSKIKDTAGGILLNWPWRLNVLPPRIHLSLSGISPRTFDDDLHLWKQRIEMHYGRALPALSEDGYRNVMDMNAGLGGFAAALSEFPVWVMNVVPYDSEQTLGIIYERGLIGTYMNWCEAFSTYPRTYDLIHANGLFSMYINKCDIQDILLEMYRILRPHGAVIVRDHVDIIFRVKDMMEQMGWKSRVSHSERGPYHQQKVLVVDNTQTT